MKKFFLFPLLFGVLFLASNAAAAGYGSAGCGFGSTLIKENKVLHQIGAAILNSVSGNQTFGISSGTSGCGASGLILAKKEQQIFVEENFFSLAKEMASGKGETLETFASLLGCSPESHGEFGTFTKHHYGTLFQNEKTTAIELIDAVQKEIPKDEKLSASCTSIQI